MAKKIESPSQQEMELVPSPDNTTMTAKEAAQFVLAYAKRHRILHLPADDEVDIGDYSSKEFAHSRKNFESQNVLEALRNREINFVGYDEVRKRVLIFLRKKASQQILKILPSSIERQVNIEYYEGGIPWVRGAQQSSMRPEPYLFVNGSAYACGGSIYPANCIGAGTLGALARNRDGKLFGLTNNHVSGVCNNAEPGLPILAPGPLDVRADGCEPFTIGRHTSLLPIHDGHPDNIDIGQNLDAACFEILNENRVSSMQAGYYDTPNAVAPLEVGMRVQKVGRTTGLTHGEVIAVSGGPAAVSYEVKEYGVRKQVYFTDEHMFLVRNKSGTLFSAGGDSGSLVVCSNDDGRLTSVGLVFAGDERNALSFVLPLDKVLENLNLVLVSGLNT